MQRILVVDDDPLTLKQLEHALESESYEVEAHENWETAFESIRKQAVDLVITDIVMPGMTGIEAIEVLKREFPTVPVFAISGVADRSTLLRKASKLGALCVFDKPLDIGRVVDSVSAVLVTE